MNARQRITPVPTRRKAADEVLAGATVQSIAEKYRVSHATVRRWRNEQESGELDLKGIHPPSYGDRRMLLYCIHCGAKPDTQDHNPSYIFLDKPYPDELATVGVCDTCNNGFSKDEPYLAAFIEAARTGDHLPSKNWRPKMRGVVKNDRRLSESIAASRSEADGTVFWAIDLLRVKKVVEKLARGHAAFELTDWPDDTPPVVKIVPLHVLDIEARRAFETPPRYPGWPEVGSRALYRRMRRFPSDDQFGWVCIQAGRYRYAADGSGNNATVRMVFSEYLAAEVIWED